MMSDNSQFYLSRFQQDLLTTALSSNQPNSMATPPQPNRMRAHSQSISQASEEQNGFYDPSTGTAPGSARLDFGVDDSPYLDFDLDADAEDTLDFDVNGKMIGDIPDSNTNGDLHEKRKSIDGKDDDDEGGGKRREGDDKSSKKPGRKPLTSEPTSKRKAQNRAAQRAFRERKEKHLKDLETKVEDLEKASESTNHENGLLRAQVDRLQIELKEYRKRLSWASTSGAGRSSSVASMAPGSATRETSGQNSNNFQFDFPKFGDLPGNHIFTNGGTSKPQGNNPTRSSTLPTKSSTPNPGVPGVLGRKTSDSSPNVGAPSYSSTGNSPMNNTFTASPPALPQQSTLTSGNMDGLSGLFSPSILAATQTNTSGDYFQTNSDNNVNQSSLNTVDNTGVNGVPSLFHTSSVSNTDSPSSSSESQHPASSIGTSPEPSLSSPSNNKLNDFGLDTISEENQVQNIFGGEPSFSGKLALAYGNFSNPIPPALSMSNGADNPLGSTVSSSYDPNGINWLAQQNGSGLDMVLFGNYRESQDAVVAQDFGTFFNDAFPLPDLGSPLHNFNDIAPSPTPKVDLMKQVEAAQNGEEQEVVPGEDRAKMMTCNKIWSASSTPEAVRGADMVSRDRLQSMEKFRNGEIDVDNLCTELRAKARCSESGAVVDEKDVDKILGKAK